MNGEMPNPERRDSGADLSYLAAEPTDVASNDCERRAVWNSHGLDERELEHSPSVGATHPSDFGRGGRDGQSSLIDTATAMIVRRALRAIHAAA